MKYKCILLFLLFFLFTSCLGNQSSLGKNSSRHLKIRVSAVSENGGEIQFKIFPENDYGDIVTVTDEKKSVNLCEFNNNAQVYLISLEPNTSKNYQVEVISNLDNESYSLEIPHSVLSQKPVIEIFKDAKGNNVLSGQTLSFDDEIQVAWKNLEKDVVYNIYVKSTFKTVFSAATKNVSITIPAKTLEKGSSYTLYINAQKIYGDPFFKKSNYYSVSSITSSGLSFYGE